MLDDMGDRLKDLEQMEAGRRLLPTLPICVRIDGKGFSKWTSDLERPYDVRLSKVMIETTKFLVEETNASIGYTQSDEISLVIYSEEYRKDVLYNGKIQKLTSVIASLTTAYFNSLIPIHVPEKANTLAFFDTRVWNVPTLIEASNVILWREFDATKNSISMAAQHYFSHNQLHGKNGKEKQEMLFQEKGVNWNDYPDFFKRGTYVRRNKQLIKFTSDELSKLPEKHEARQNPELLVERHVVEEVSIPPFIKVDNKINFLFFGKDPIISEVERPIQLDDE